MRGLASGHSDVPSHVTEVFTYVRAIIGGLLTEIASLFIIYSNRDDKNREVSKFFTA